MHPTSRSCDKLSFILGPVTKKSTVAYQVDEETELVAGAICLSNLQLIVHSSRLLDHLLNCIHGKSCCGNSQNYSLQCRMDNSYILAFQWEAQVLISRMISAQLPRDIVIVT